LLLPSSELPELEPKNTLEPSDLPSDKPFMFVAPARLSLVSESEEAGVYIVVSKDKKQIFVTGHSEYDPDTLKQEWERDMKKGIDIELPENYDIEKPKVKWRSHSNLLYNNWINYYVYQMTPYLSYIEAPFYNTRLYLFYQVQIYIIIRYVRLNVS